MGRWRGASGISEVFFAQSIFGPLSDLVRVMVERWRVGHEGVGSNPEGWALKGGVPKGCGHFGSSHFGSRISLKPRVVSALEAVSLSFCVGVTISDGSPQGLAGNRSHVHGARF